MASPDISGQSGTGRFTSGLSSQLALARDTHREGTASHPRHLCGLSPSAQVLVTALEGSWPKTGKFEGQPPNPRGWGQELERGWAQPPLMFRILELVSSFQPKTCEPRVCDVCPSRSLGNQLPLSF